VNPLIIHAHIHPKKLTAQRNIAIVLIHGGVHATLTLAKRTLSQFVEQGNSGDLNRLRGSTGYGRGFYEQIDYAGAKWTMFLRSNGCSVNTILSTPSA